MPGSIKGKAGSGGGKHRILSRYKLRPVPVPVVAVRDQRFPGCGMLSTWNPPSTRMISPVVQAPASEAR